MGHTARRQVRLSPWLPETHLVDLRELDLGYMQMSKSSIEGLGRVAFTKLERLRLQGVNVDARFAGILAEANFASTLCDLDLTKSAIDDDGLAALAAAKSLRQLARLDLTDCRSVHDRGVLALIESKLPLREVIVRGVRLAPATRRAVEQRFTPR